MMYSDEIIERHKMRRTRMSPYQKRLAWSAALALCIPAAVIAYLMLGAV